MQRPAIDLGIIQRAAEATAAEFDDRSEVERNELAKAIAQVYAYPMTAYRLARALDDETSIDVDSLDIGELELMDYNVNEEHRKVCQAWVRDHGIQPPLPIGTRIINHVSGEVGIIDEFADERSPACYLVKPEGQDDEKTGHMRWVIKFEDAIAAPRQLGEPA